ncbi:hypothetical protein LTR72_010256 [Exophiala xenobiotica]|nr:hypothetical protein LTR72_010256 [Exophiala xenobiotica]KAK5286948.1 hypothetical protein LTR14_009693 [Exophiala xenobiotica]KAK5478153.1 hypothetical protein LTR55_008137 [Exophiala xenobiotica]
MGNIGRPSTGCGLCRKRRVKCDEGQPGCRNCARLKKPCPGYRVPGYGTIRPTIFVPGPQSPTQGSRSTESLPQAWYYSRRATSTEAEDSDAAQSDSALEISAQSFHRPASMARLPEDVIEQGVWYSLSQLDVSSRVLYGNDAFTFLPAILRKAGSQSYLHTAMRAVGIINLANRSPTVDMRNAVDLEYAKAVSGVNTALADPEQRLKDETLVAVWLLGIRELLANVTGSGQVNPGGSSARQAHIDGTLMLLQLRGDHQFSTPEGCHLYQLILSSMHWKPLFAGEEPSQEYLILESQISKAVQDLPKASIRLRNFFHGVSKLRARIKNFLSIGLDRTVDEENLVASYLKAAEKLQGKVADWCDIPEWFPRRVIAESSHATRHRTPWTSGTLFRLHCFGSWEGFFHWNRYFAAKICLHAALLDALSAKAREQERVTRSDLETLHTTALQETVQDFIGTLSYAFGDVDENGHCRSVPSPAVSEGNHQESRGINVPATMQVQPPLAFLTTLRYLGPGQREAMFLALQRVRAEFCLR